MGAHALHTKKRFGQNFLVDHGVLEDIVAAVEARNPPGLIEIGAGLGVLTRALLKIGCFVVAIEKDRTLFPVLQRELGDASELQLFEGDALRVDFQSVHPGTKPHVVGNIPYNISSPLMMHLIRQKSAIGDVTLMVQKEVAERWMAAPKSKAYGSPSVMIQVQADLHSVRRVPPQCFLPPPKVDSMVIQIRWRSTPRVPIGHLAHFERVVRAAFSQRRKTLRNALRTRFSPTELEAAEAALDLGRRAETLTLAEFSLLASRVKSE